MRGFDPILWLHAFAESLEPGRSCQFVTSKGRWLQHRAKSLEAETRIIAESVCNSYCAVLPFSTILKIFCLPATSCAGKSHGVTFRDGRNKGNGNQDIRSG